MLEWLPHINASLNSITTLFLISGFIAIRKEKIQVHRAFMALALLTSTLFLTSYLIYHFEVGATRYTGVGWVRKVYFSILISHTVLATAIVPLVFMTVYHALRKSFEKHKKIARWTLPLWLYVSVTGVIIYLFLY